MRRRLRLSVIVLAIAALVIGIFAARSYLRSVQERTQLVAPMGQVHKEQVEKGAPGKEKRLKAVDKEEELYEAPKPIELGE